MLKEFLLSWIEDYIMDITQQGVTSKFKELAFAKKERMLSEQTLSKISNDYEGFLRN